MTRRALRRLGRRFGERATKWANGCRTALPRRARRDALAEGREAEAKLHAGILRPGRRLAMNGRVGTVQSDNRCRDLCPHPALKNVRLG